MNRDYYNSYIKLLKAAYKYDRATKDCADYFLNKYFKKKAQGLNVTVEDM